MYVALFGSLPGIGIALDAAEFIHRNERSREYQVGPSCKISMGMEADCDWANDEYSLYLCISLLGSHRGQ